MGKLQINGGLKVQGRVVGSGDDEGIVIDYASNNWAGLTLGSPSAKRSVFYLSTSGLPRWRYNDGSDSYDITHPGKAGTIALTSDIPTTMAWSSITGKPSTFTPSSHTHSYLPLAGGTMNSGSQIVRAGQSSSWYNGRDKAMIRQNTINGYSPIMSIKSTNGTWEMGCYDNSSYLDRFILGYKADSEYNAGTPNSIIHAFNLTKEGNAIFSGSVTATSFSGNASSASSVPWSGVTGKPSSFTPASHTHSQYASIGAHNNLTASGNEFTFASGAFSGEMYINYRTASGSLDGNITRYKFQNGKGSNTAIECSYVYGTAQAADYATSAGYAGYLPSYTEYSSTSSLDGFLTNGVLRWAKANAAALTFGNDGSVISVGWGGGYGSQVWLDDGSGPAKIAVRNRSGGSSWNAWRHCIMSCSETYYGGSLPSSGSVGDVFFKT